MPSVRSVRAGSNDRKPRERSGYEARWEREQTVIRPGATCLKPLPERSASTQEYRLRSTSWAGRQAGH